jgi:hypothetical protein
MAEVIPLVAKSPEPVCPSCEAGEHRCLDLFDHPEHGLVACWCPQGC